MTETRHDGSARRSSAVEEPGQERLGPGCSSPGPGLCAYLSADARMLRGQAYERAGDGVLAISEHLHPYA
jgi:hypothetical protein